MSDGRFGALAKRLREPLLRSQALSAARAQLPGRHELAGRAFTHVRLLRDVARQVMEPADPPPSGHRAAVALSLHRDEVYWLLAADAPGLPSPDADLAALWSQAPRDKLLRAARGEANLEAVRRLLLDMSPPASLDATKDDVEQVRAFADALYDDLAVPRRRVVKIIVQRWLHLAAVATAVVTIALIIRAIALGPNLAAEGHMRTSSRFPDCAADAGCAALLFHTNPENGPWVEFDLGAPTPIQVIDVRNRPDCCRDRAVPLVAEISNDGAHWKEVGRQDKEFSRWKVKIPRTVTRFVRLRVPRHTYFGFADVAIR